MIEKGIFTFSADPITYGHIDIILKALQKVKLLYVVIAYNPGKKYLLSLVERKHLVEKVFSNYSKIKVISHCGLIADLMLRENITHYFRGIRNQQDQLQERITAIYNKKKNPNFKMVCIRGQNNYKHISSSAIKKLYYFTKDISDYTPLIVKRYLEQKNNIVQMAITGSIASGKTTFCQIIKENIAQYLSKNLLKKETQKLLFDYKTLIANIHYIDFDEIVKQIYDDLTKNQLPLLKEQLLKQFKNKILDQQGNITIHSIRSFIFLKSKFFSFTFSPINKTNVQKIKFKIAKLQKILFPFIMMYYRQMIKDKKGLFLLEIPMLAEYSLANIFNGDIIVVHADEKKQLQRIMSRDKIDQAQARQKIALANHTQTKINLLQNQINLTKYKNHLNLFVYHNNYQSCKNKENVLLFFKKKFINISQNRID